MDKLDNLTYIKSLDSENTLESIKFLPLQIQSSWEKVKKMKFPSEYSLASSILFCGMGGSAYAYHLIKNLYQNELKIPLDLVNDYNIPGFANHHTLVIVSSYSGNTEEVISCLKQAIYKKCMIVGITSGGQLHEILKDNNYPQFVFEEKYNPSHQPRIGQGYMQIGAIGILNQLKYVFISDRNITELADNIKKAIKKIEETEAAVTNPAKKLALLSSEKIINFVGGEFLTGAIHAVRNPIHETGKQFANYFLLPELNHHLMEGLSFPNSIKTNMIFILINSNLYSSVIVNRLNLTREVIRKNKISTYDLNLIQGSKLKQIFELILFGSFLSFYLAMIHGINPAKIPWVDFFKKQLKESKLS